MDKLILNVERIVQDAKKRQQQPYPTGYLAAGVICLFFGTIFAIGLFMSYDGKITLRSLLLPMLLIVSGVVFLWFQYNAVKRWADKLLAGNFHLIQNSVRSISDRLDDDLLPERYLNFHFHDIHGWYKSACSKNEVETVHIGDEYYLVLQSNRKGKLFVICHYPVESTLLDEFLSQMLCRDKDLTGYHPSVKDIINNLRHYNK